MADIKWIKIRTDMFEHEKLEFIQSLPEADAIIVIWIRLLTLAGKSNAGGYILLTESIPYTEEMLAHRFRKPPAIIKLALETLKRLNMIDYDGDAIVISNWEKHQNADALERIREYEKNRKRLQREKNKLLKASNDGTSHGNVPDKSRNVRSLDIEIDKEIDREINTTTAIVPDAFRFFEQNGFGTISPYIAQEIQRMINEYSEPWVIKAMQEAVSYGKRTLRYVEGILQRFKSEGADEPWKVEKQKKVFSTTPKKPDMPVVEDNGPAREMSPEELEHLYELARKLKGA